MSLFRHAPQNHNLRSSGSARFCGHHLLPAQYWHVLSDDFQRLCPSGEIGHEHPTPLDDGRLANAIGSHAKCHQGPEAGEPEAEDVGRRGQAGGGGGRGEVGGGASRGGAGEGTGRGMGGLRENA